MSDQTVLVVGATGTLGTQVTRSLLRRGARVRALVTPGSVRGKRAALTALADGGRLDVVVGDITDLLDDLVRTLEGADIVVSAVQGGPDVVTDGQVNLIRAAGKAGVPRLIPSDFAVDLHRLDYGDNAFLDHRKRADEAFAEVDVAPVHVLTGAFTEVMVAPFVEIVDFDNGTFSYWGDGDEPMDFTTVADTAEYAAAVALDPGIAGRKIGFAGDVLTMKQFHAAVEEGSGRSLEARSLGSTDVLLAEIERRKQTGAGIPEYVALQYQWAMVTGKAKLDPLENERYPEVTPVPVAEFVRTRAAAIDPARERAS